MKIKKVFSGQNSALALHKKGCDETDIFWQNYRTTPLSNRSASIIRNAVDGFVRVFIEEESYFRFYCRCRGSETFHGTISELGFIVCSYFPFSHWSIRQLLDVLFGKKFGVLQICFILNIKIKNEGVKVFH